MHIYLYVKQHQSTGLLYFGKTICRDPFAYQGSGTYWKRHLKKHGPDISTIELWGFDNQDDCTRFALEFSEKHCIVESKEWANLRPENGLDGGAVGTKSSEETKAKLRARTHSEETKAKMRAAKLGRKRKPFSEEHKAKKQAAMIGKNLGKKRSEEAKAKMRAAWMIRRGQAYI
jgi:hypothetical protein